MPAGIARGSLLIIHDGQPLCLRCAGMEHLTSLPAGNTAMTRRAKMHSKLWAVVVRFSRARKRYERQGLLVEEGAVALTQEECRADENPRRDHRIQAAKHRKEEDRALAETMRAKILEMFPNCPRADAETIARHTSVRGSGRVGRSKSGRNLEEEALRLAMIAHIRHCHTRYDDLCCKGKTGPSRGGRYETKSGKSWNSGWGSPRSSGKLGTRTWPVAGRRVEHGGPGSTRPVIHWPTSWSRRQFPCR